MSYYPILDLFPVWTKFGNLLFKWDEEVIEMEPNFKKLLFVSLEVSFFAGHQQYFCKWAKLLVWVALFSEPKISVTILKNSQRKGRWYFQLVRIYLKVIIILKISIFAFPVSNAILYSFIGSRFKSDLMKTLGSRRSDLRYRDSRATLLERISFRKSTKTSRLSVSPTRNNPHINAPTQTKTTTTV